ncbi:hypothetical protein [Dapis sp. BLCC M126]|uniref:hypothetical protein n=1 Tax=Dapis sp. BLCC M126 TaxID=3400189 RepID=UPI003CFB572A
MIKRNFFYFFTGWVQFNTNLGSLFCKVLKLSTSSTIKRKDSGESDRLTGIECINLGNLPELDKKSNYGKVRI